MNKEFLMGLNKGWLDQSEAELEEYKEAIEILKKYIVILKERILEYESEEKVKQ